jgi:hypothetical protein
LTNELYVMILDRLGQSKYIDWQSFQITFGDILPTKLWLTNGYPPIDGVWHFDWQCNCVRAEQILFSNYKTCYIRQPVCAIVTQAWDEFDQTVPSRHHRICINGLLVLSNVEYIGKQSSDAFVLLGWSNMFKYGTEKIVNK